MFKNKYREHHPMRHPEHREAVIYLDEAVPRASPEVLHARRGDCITFSAVSADFNLELPDIFTVSIFGRFRVRQNGNLSLIVRDDAEYRVYRYGIVPEAHAPAMADPTIIIHNGD